MAATATAKATATAATTTTTTTTARPGLPAAVFAKLNPPAFLHAHLSLPSGTRPGGGSRGANDFRAPHVNTGSLSHAHGSAVVRTGDTAVVSGIRIETLDVRRVPTFDGRPAHELSSHAQRERISEMGLLVANVELAAGACKNTGPGSAPSALVQSLSWRIGQLLHALDLVSLEQLEIRWRKPNLTGPTVPKTQEEPEEDQMQLDDKPDGQKPEQEELVVAGYFVLYLDLVIISLAGTPLDALWASLLSALSTTLLPCASFSADLDSIIVSPHRSDAQQLLLNGSMPICVSFGVFEPGLFRGLKQERRTWILADPDEAEEQVCRNQVVVVVEHHAERGIRIRSLHSSGGFVLGPPHMQHILDLAAQRWAEWKGVLEDIVG